MRRTAYVGEEPVPRQLIAESATRELVEDDATLGLCGFTLTNRAHMVVTGLSSGCCWYPITGRFTQPSAR